MPSGKCGCDKCAEKRKGDSQSCSDEAPPEVKETENSNCSKFKCEICEKYAAINEGVLCSSFCKHLFSPAGQEDKCVGSCSRKSSNKTEDKSV
ncbi:uncharacterized protein LOC112904291 isoform X2 [Agrilus planipennis]|uniref:Uncharacterized protein LOC112904291 isoform X2 n=1 Tax=Agrilus planipennis TaxID=224129 RepID=A0A7F5R3F2_AGRPL|nr:uncharacterized protein LOC112904291 isoform X2 [Agrilus planipennis]